jgi:lysophospholipase L1-like esterase
MTIRALGDSFTYGYGSTAGHGYLEVLSRLLAKPITNLGVSGAQVPDQTDTLCGINVVAGDLSLLELGTNDHWRYGADATRREYFRRGIQACAAWLGLVDKQKGVVNATTTGKWANTTSFGIGKMSDTAGSTITWQVSGEVVYLGTIQFDCNASRFSVKIDGVDKGTFDTGTTGLTTYKNFPCGPRLLRFPGLTPGMHEVVFTALGGDFCYAEWCAGSDSVKAPVYVANITRNTAAGNALCPIYIDDASLAAFNATLAGAMGELIADGLDITVIDNSAIFFPDADTFSDGVHPNDTGHAKIAMNFFRNWKA